MRRPCAASQSRDPLSSMDPGSAAVSRCAASGERKNKGRERSRPSFFRHCEEHLRRSNPYSRLSQQSCIASLAMTAEDSSFLPLPLWERSDRIGDAIRVRGYGLSIDLNPSPQPSPTRGEGAHRRCCDTADQNAKAPTEPPPRPAASDSPCSPWRRRHRMSPCQAR
jgi:hypothetical protein